MRRAYVDVPGPGGPWQLHVRRAGRGPLLVLLHPSPLSSAFLEPVAERLSDRFDCVALDTPGYGQSDPLPRAWDEPDLAPYVRALLALIDTLDAGPALIYGSATGAQIALEFAKAHPQRCAGLLLENVALFSERERRDIVASYFPDATPQADGSHLQRLWQMASRSTRYFPWYDTAPGADRRGVDAPPTVTGAMLRDHLLAGSGYDRAYRAAFANEGPEALTGLGVATRIIQWEDSILGDFASRLEDAELPATVALRHAGTGMAARMNAVSDAADELVSAA